MSRWLLPMVLLWAICGIAGAGVFHDPALKWRTIETDHFRIHYHNGEAALAQSFWPKAEAVYQDTCAYLNWYPLAKTEVVLTALTCLSRRRMTSTAWKITTTGWRWCSVTSFCTWSIWTRCVVLPALFNMCSVVTHCCFPMPTNHAG